MERVAVLAITNGGIRTGKRLLSLHPDWRVFAPSKFSDGSDGITWFEERTPEKIAEIFKSHDGIICTFSLGAVIRLISPHLVDKKTDPAVIIIDDRAEFVISALSGHIGGANELARDIAKELDATPVITTAADVNKTVSVDMVGRNEGWRIDGDKCVTQVSAMMVNAEKIGMYQDAGALDVLRPRLPANVTEYSSIDELEASPCTGALVITDRKLDALSKPAVVYRPRSLVIGVGLHRDTPTSKILDSLSEVLRRSKLSKMCVSRLASVKKPADVKSLRDAADSLGVPLELVERTELARLETPNPSDTVARLEGTPSVSEAAALLLSDGGKLVVQKQKFPPDLTIAVARMRQ